MLDLGIAGRRAIVCASSRGLGKACARALARAGVAVVVNGLDEARLEATAAELARETGAEITAVAADVTTRAGQAKLLAALPDPDILVTNAGGPPFKDFRELSREAILTGVTWNMVTPIELIQATIDKMVERRFGRVVNVTSISVRMPVQGLDLSSGARAGLTAFLAGVARSVAHAGVTINNVLPGFFDTDRYWAGVDATAKLQGKTREQFAEERAATVPARRIGDPQELGDACAFLCSARAGYITGQNLLLDGGLFNSAF
ncbi:MAG: short chain dehydrogenase/reductase family oxidoreductase [Geminicoccaceae bacterium]|jgi:3-oxoacyl-[acyl-carrier protein] reductase|nr:short chain dehydrogenase/reductase family oxidoreductase [Geminicoccaceae bacterium]